jgi:hypothetical protein
MRIIACLALALASLAAAGQVVDQSATVRQRIAAVEAAGGGIVKLPAGVVWVSADDAGTAIQVPASVFLDLRGTELRLIENDKGSYQMLLFTGTSSGVAGGSIVGDRDRHLDKGGEWGMCLSVRGATDVTIRDTKISGCWGDGIYVGAASSGTPVPSRRVTIENVEVSNNRRNNISIVAAVGFRIANAHLHGARGVPPEAGIDLEPNHHDLVQDGEIVGVLTESNARYGFVIGGQAGAVRQVKIDDVRAVGNGGPGFWLQSTSALAIGSIVAARNRREGLVFENAKDISVGNYRSEGNERAALDARGSTGIKVREMHFADVPLGIVPVQIDRHSTIDVGGR